MRGKGKAQAQRRRQLRTEKTGTQQPYRHVQARARHRTYRLVGLRGFEVMQQFLHIARELFRTIEVAAQRACGRLIGARCTAQPQIDATGIQRRQRAELFGHL